VGMSGGPLIIQNGEELLIVGIHSSANRTESNRAVHSLDGQIKFINDAMADNP